MPAADDKKAVFMFSNTECAERIRITNKYIFLLLLYRKQKYAIIKGDGQQEAHINPLIGRTSI